MSGCANAGLYREVFRLYDLTGTLVRNQTGRRQDSGEQGLSQGSGSRFWWVGLNHICTPQPQEYGYIQRLTARGDTLQAWPALALPPLRNRAMAIREVGRRVVVAGWDSPQGVNGQAQRYTLTSVDSTTGQVAWRYSYDRPGFSNDYVTDFVRTPRGGYLLSGDGQVLNSGYQHLFLETDSLGRQLKQRLIHPLGPNYTDGSRFATFSNLVALPNAGGYLATGMADSVQTNGIHNKTAYLMRLDTALNVMWVYRHPPAYQGNGNRNQEANKVRLLPNGTAAFLVHDVRGVGTPDLYLVNVDPATGQRLGTYVLSSNTQAAVIPFDWQWVGDGTLVVCGKSQQAGVAVVQGWLARFDLRNTPLGTLSAASAESRAGQLLAWPNPARGQVRLRWPAAWAGTEVALYDVLGRVVVRQALAAGQAQAELSLAGVGPGVYALRLRTAQGTVSQRLLVE